jgi:cytochrome c553
MQPCAELLLPVAALLAAQSTPGAPPAAAALRADQELRVVLQAAPDSEHGERLFAICAECHGARGEGKASGWPPQIAGQHPRVIAKELVDYRAGLRWYDPMQRIAGRHVLHTLQDIADVASFAAGLPASSATTPGPGTSIATGAELYMRRCQSCHGAGGEGNNERFVPRVAGQQYEYLLRQLHDTLEGRRPNMRSQHLRLIASSSMQELVSLADYMSRLGRPARP